MIKVLVLITALMFPSLCRADTMTGLAGWWKLDDNTGTNAADSSGNNHPGTLTNGPTWTSGHNGGYAVSFDGVDDVVVTSTPVTTVTDNVSLSAWVYWSGATSSSVAVLYNGNTGANGYGIFIGDNSCGVGSKVNILVGGINCNALSSPPTLSTNTWTHLVIIRNSGTWTMYVNGVQEAGSGVNTPNVPTTATSIGSNHAGSGTFSGIVDDARIYTRALSTADVLELYTGGIDLHNGLVGWWKLDDGTGTSAIDSSGSGNTGTLNNGPGWVDGRKGRAVALDGTNDYISMGTSALTSVDNSDKTVSAWIRKTANSQKGIVDKDFDSGGSNYGGWGLWTQSNGKLWWWTHPSKDLLDNGSQTIALGEWTHVAITWSNSSQTARFYINGTLNSTQTDNTIVEKASGSADLEIGDLRNHLNGGQFAFDGSIDDVRVYNRALSASEITALYTWTSRLGNGKIRNAKINF